jgi:hypothetical protein
MGGASFWFRFSSFFRTSDFGFRICHPPAFRTSRRRGARIKAKKQFGPPTPAALTLVSAEYAKNDWVRLTFNRPIDITALDGTQIEVDDDEMSGNHYNGSLGGTLINPTTVEIDLDRTGSATESGVHLLASASTGIVAVDDESEWSGATDLALPFP